ncbi:hypothetical protein DH2020_016458 [Rehmannia glutinosa]|uniref:Endonuclease/exonuclease/phosphatase domain-containing protein n=1 Tax=Rehmannia glutinosa TaxID=99300 RepID=A0ABR0WN16_REHGL
MHGLAVEPHGRSGGLALLWQKDIPVSLRAFSDRFIDAYVDLLGNSFRFTGVYGEPNVTLRRAGWDLLRHLRIMSEKPWLMCGDFNEVLEQREFQGSNLRAEWQINLFRDTFSHLNMFDLGFEGHPFTWSRILNHPRTQRARLDRAASNPDWKNIFPWSRVVHHPTYYSDHSLLHIQVRTRDPSTYRGCKRRPFRFEALWVRVKDCEEVIKTCWECDTGPLPDKLRDCSIGLLNWGKHHRGELDTTIKNLKEKIASLRTGPISDRVRDEILNLQNLLEVCMDLLDLKWKQRAKLHWYREGDRNTRFFHNRANKRKQTNIISSLKDDAERTHDSTEGIERVIVDYFGTFFSSSDPSTPDISQAIGRLTSRDVEAPIRGEILDLLGFKEVENHGKYLRLPSVIGRNKKEIFGYIKDKIWQRIQNWGTSLFSKAVKEVLIKSVLQAIPTYAMGCFKFPDSVILDIQRLIASFWWGNSPSNRKIHWASWDSLARWKNLGGLGFRSFKAFNLALLSKQAWRILTNPSSLIARVFKAKYFENGEFLEAQLGTRPSWTWRSILQGRRVLKLGCLKRICSGNNCKIWNDEWLPKPLFRLRSRLPDHIHPESLVSTLIDPDSRTWKYDIINSLFAADEAALILAIPLGHSTRSDSWYWYHSKNGKFSVKSAYHLILDNPSDFSEAPEFGTSSSGISPYGKNYGPSKSQVVSFILHGNSSHERSPVQPTLPADTSPIAAIAHSVTPRRYQRPTCFFTAPLLPKYGPLQVYQTSSHALAKPQVNYGCKT